MTQANKEQMRILASFMEKNPRDAHRLLWDKLFASLNENGPPTKTNKEWKRVWAIKKYNAKKKLLNNKKSIVKTGRGPFSEEVLDENDEAIIKACGMNAAIEGISGAKSFGCEEEDYETLYLYLTESPDNLNIETELQPIQKDYSNVEKDSKPKQNMQNNEKIMPSS